MKRNTCKFCNETYEFSTFMHEDDAKKEHEKYCRVLGIPKEKDLKILCADCAKFIPYLQGTLEDCIERHKSDGECYIDNVNHPSHYKNHPSGIECIEVTQHMNFNLGNAVKYIWRAGEKGKLVEDLEKAIWYLKQEIKRVGV